MPDNRTVDEYSLEELEGIVAQRRRLERARKFAEDAEGQSFRPVTVMPAEEKESRRPARAPRVKGWRDRLLLLVEIGAALGLIAIIVGSLTSLQTLNQVLAGQVEILEDVFQTFRGDGFHTDQREHRCGAGDLGQLGDA